jgi:hypothetical protein
MNRHEHEIYDVDRIASFSRDRVFRQNQSEIAILHYIE